jgi:hypothetical protein
VAFCGDVMTWELRDSGEYDALAAYKAQPHREFMDADSDEGLRIFVKHWGPLRALKSGTDSVSWYREKRDFLVAVVRFLKSIERDLEDWRLALIELLDASGDSHDAINRFFMLDRQLGLTPGDPSTGVNKELKDWCKSTSSGEIERLCVRLVEAFPITAVPSFRVQKRGRKNHVRASLFINNLHEAIWWMVWEDLFRAEPIRFCKECSRLIHSDNKHERKYCGRRCAKRRADRDSARRRRASLKKRKRERKKP